VDSGLQTSSTAGEKPAVTPDAREAARGKRFGALVPALARLGVTPDMVSWAGLGLAIACGACLAVGASHTLPLGGPKPDASWWPVLAGLMLGLSALADLLDGDLARARGAGSRFGALLDSTLDRFGDAAILTGCALHFAALGNVSYVLLACLGLTVTIQVSYVKARSETLVEAPKRSVGYWQRGERMVALLCACFLGHVAAGLWMTALFPLATIWGRVREGKLRIEAAERGEPPPPSSTWLVRNSPAYLLTCATLVLLLAVAPIVPLFRPTSDPMRALFGG
jgi:CDP-diacylglycerol--glycerol-3-phosphate 3-phosphatidyltransferase